MPPTLALFLWLILLVGLLRFDPAKDSGVSLALWVPLIWIFIIGSRLPSQWLGGSVGSAAQALEEGNPLDRTIFSVLIVLAIATLISRSFNWSIFFTRNFVLVLFLFFTLASALWSDFPLVSLKRWFRDLGNYLVILIVLSDPRPLEAVRTLLRRLCYVLVPLSILLIKYFPYLGKQYSEWTGAAEFMGATTSKNMLGVLCLISGIFFFWDTLTRWSDRKIRGTWRIIVVNIAFIAMTLWLLNVAGSATSTVCLVMGCLVVVAAHSEMFRRHPGFLRFLIPAIFCVYLVLAYGFDINGNLAGAVGRDPTLTDRTAIWKLLLTMHTNPLLGTGYESFWLGPRLKLIWQRFGHINESHNGYLEVYLNLGLIGFFLLCGLLISSYRTICKRLTSASSLALLNLALWTIMLFYNMTEAAFKSHLMWVTFLLAAIAVPERAEDRVRGASALDNPGPTERSLRLPLESARQRRWSCVRLPKHPNKLPDHTFDLCEEL
ncbi:MAG: O-antigen ligase family protein [Halobacteriota archaeon]|jgi:O-antigen ligase